jgi:hypothetical protein
MAHLADFQRRWCRKPSQRRSRRRIIECGSSDGGDALEIPSGAAWTPWNPLRRGCSEDGGQQLQIAWTQAAADVPDRQGRIDSLGRNDRLGRLAFFDERHATTKLVTLAAVAVPS